MYGMDSFSLGYVPVTDCFEHGNERSGYIKGEDFSTRLPTISFSRRTQLHEASCNECTCLRK